VPFRGWHLEGIFTPAEPVGREVGWDEVFTGYCDGAQQAAELHGVQVRLTPDIPRGFPPRGSARSSTSHTRELLESILAAARF